MTAFDNRTVTAIIYRNGSNKAVQEVGGQFVEDYAIELKGVTKTFGQVVANDNVNLTLKKGEIGCTIFVIPSV